MRDLKHWRGLSALVHDAVEKGSLAVEEIQKHTARRTFSILESIPPIAPVARGIHVVHDASVSSVHVAIRAVNRAVGVVVASVLAADARKDG
jgi:hypothetical protein